MSKSDATTVDKRPGARAGAEPSGLAWAADLVDGSARADDSQTDPQRPLDELEGVAFAAGVPAPPPELEPPLPPARAEVAAAAPAAPPAPPVAPPPPAKPTSLAEAWPAEPGPSRKRELPPRTLLIAGGVAALFLVPLLFGLAGSSKSHGDGSRDPLPTDLIVDEQDIKNRVQVRPDDFRVRSSERAPAAVSAFGASGPATAPDPSTAEFEATLAERRARRDNDPEDLIAHRGGERSDASKGGGASERGDAKASMNEYRREVIYLDPTPSPGAQRGSASRTGGRGHTLAPAGTLVGAVLASPLQLSGGAATVVAKIDGDGALPDGAKVIGTATTDDDGRLTLRFSRLIVGTEELKIDGEAQDSSGAFGIQGVVASRAGAEAKSAAGDIAANTASDVATNTLDTFTGGIAGSLTRNISSRARATRFNSGSSSQLRVSLANGTAFQIFLHEAVVDRE